MNLSMRNFFRGKHEIQIVRSAAELVTIITITTTRHFATIAARTLKDGGSCRKKVMAIEPVNGVAEEVAER